ncbi:MAG: hypothetical protein ACHQK9_09870 [Reyranellales bacterium]
MLRVAFLATLVAALPCVAYAQGNTSSAADLRYCQALSERYMRYVSGDEFSSRRSARSTEVEGSVAVAKCREGDAATAIPILERKLVNARVGLPPRN